MQPKYIKPFLCIIFCCSFYYTVTGQNKTFYFPGGGERNNNSTIGDFCCTGETGTIYNNTNSVIGYIYYYGFTDSYNIGNNEAKAKTFSLLVSGVRDYGNNTERIKSRISFTAFQLYPQAKKSLQVGELYFTVTILSVQKYSDPQFYMMGSVKVQVDVSFPLALVPNPAADNPNLNPPVNSDHNNPVQTNDEPVKKILENGNVEIDYEDGRKEIISDGGITYISATGETKSFAFDTGVMPFVPPDLPNEDINRWLNSVNSLLYNLITQKLKNDQTSINNLLAGEANLNIYQIINRRVSFLDKLK